MDADGTLVNAGGIHTCRMTAWTLKQSSPVSPDSPPSVLGFMVLLSFMVPKVSRQWDADVGVRTRPPASPFCMWRKLTPSLASSLEAF